MTRKHTRRKVWPLVNPITMALAGAAITDTADLDRLSMIELSALDAFARGAATREDWRSLADMLNVSQTLSEDGVGPEALDANRAAQEALGACQERSKRHGGKLLFTGPELQAMRNAYEYADLQRSSISRSRLERAIRATADRIRSAAPSVKVYV